MKQLRPALLFAAALCAGSVFAQQPPTLSYENIAPKNGLKLNLFNFFAGEYLFSIQAERLVAPKVSLACNFDFAYSMSNTTGPFYNGSGYYTGESTISGFGAEPQFRFYPASEGTPTGFYISAFYEYFKMNISRKIVNNTGTVAEGDINITTQMPGIMLGWKFIIKKSFSAEIALGGGFRNTSSPPYLDVYDPASGSLLIHENSPESSRRLFTGTGEVLIGYAF